MIRGRHYSIEIYSQMTLVIELVEKNIKTAIENILHMFKKIEESPGCYRETWKI